LITDPDAEFTQLVRRQARFVFRVAFAVLLNAHDAEDAVQETFLKLFRNRGWQNVENERAFLARVAWRVSVDLRPRRTPDPSLPLEQELAEVWPSPLPTPEHALVSANEHAMIHSLVDALPEDLRVPLVLSTFDELSSREIGEILNLPDGTVRTRLQRARQMLREKLTKRRASTEEAHHA
jgi:RNA polymerase sigma-70 factor (ECF subfamily)